MCNYTYTTKIEACKLGMPNIPLISRKKIHSDAILFTLEGLSLVVTELWPNSVLPVSSTVTVTLALVVYFTL